MNGYDMYMGNVRMPVTPSEIKMSVNNQNTTITLINEGEVNLLKSPALTDIQFTLLIPQVTYPFANQTLTYTNKSTMETHTVLIPASYYLDLFDYLKSNRIPFRWIVSRYMPNKKKLFDTNIKVSLEDYTVKESAKQGFDLEVDISLKQYKPYSLKTITTTTPSPTAPVIVREDRDEDIPVKQSPAVGVDEGGGGGGGSKKKKTNTSGIVAAAVIGAVVGGIIGVVAGLLIGSSSKSKSTSAKSLK